MTARGWIVAGSIGLLALGGAYCAGNRAGARNAQIQADEHARHDLADSLKAAKRVTARDSVGVVRARLATVASHDTTVRAVAVDSVVRARRATLRKAIVIPAADSPSVVGSTTTPSRTDSLETLVRVDDATIAQDSLTIKAARTEAQRAQAESDSLRGLFIDVRHEATLSEARADTAEHEIRLLRGDSHRCGTTCGVVLGATVVLAITHPQQTAELATKVVGWVAHRIH